MAELLFEQERAVPEYAPAAETPTLGEGFASSLAAHAGLAALTRGQDAAEASALAREELLAGNTTSVDMLAAASGKAATRERAASALKLLSIPGLEQSVYDQAAKSYTEISGNLVTNDIVANNASNLSDVEPSAAPGQDEVLDARAKFFSDNQEANSSLESMMLHAFAQTDQVGIAAIAKQVTLPEYTAMTVQLKQHLAQRGWLETEATDYIAPGSNIKQIVELGRKLPPEEKKAYFSDVLQGILAASSVVGDPNNFVAYNIATAIKTHLQQGSEYPWYDVLADNLEAGGLLPLVSTAVRGGSRVAKTIFTAEEAVLAATSAHPNSAVATVASAAPNSSGPVLAALARNPAAAKAAGTTPTDLLVNFGLPKHHEFDLSGAPANIVDEIERAAVYGDQAVGTTLYKGFLIDAAGEAASISRAAKEAQAMAATVPDLHVHNQVVEASEEGFVVQNMFGNGNVGFARKSAAIDKARESGLFDIQSAQFEIVRFNPATKELRVVYNGAKDFGKAFADTGGEFYIRTRTAQRYDDAFATPIVPEQVPKMGLITQLAEKISGRFTTFRSVEAILPREVAKKVTANFTGKVALKNALNVITKGYDKLKDAEKARVMHTIVEGSNFQSPSGQVIGKEFSYSELAAKGLTEKEIVGYFQIRELTRTTHSIRNRALYEELTKSGQKRFVHEAYDFDTLGRAVGADDIDSVMSDVVEVFDVASKKAISASAAGIKDAYGKGAVLVRLKSAMRQGADRYEYALVPDALDAARELPSTVLSDVAGWAGPRVYLENLFVEATSASARLNGKALSAADARRTSVIAAAKSKEEAAAIIKDLEASAAPGTTYNVRLGRELIHRVDEMELDAVSGGLYYSKRGQPLVGADMRAARVIDPVRAIEINKNNITKLTHSDTIITQLKYSWTSTYGHLSSNKGQFPLTRDLITSSDAAKADEVNKARAMWDLIEGYEAFGEENKIYRFLSFKLAQMLDVEGASKLRQVGADWAYASAREGTSPLTKLKSAAFATTIAMRPIRQLFLQAAQHGYLGSVDPAAFGQSYKQVAGIMAMKSAKAMGRGDGYALGAKAAGMPEREFRSLVDGFESSGLLAQIDTHAFTSGAIRDPQASLWDGVSASYFKDKAMDTFIRTPVHFMRKWGFDKGEGYNQLLTYLFSYNRISKQQGKAVNMLSRKEFDNLIGETNLLTFNMTGAGELGMQKGWMRNITQFMSFQMKSLQNISGATQTFTPAERLRIGLVTLGLWGAGGFGIREWYLKLKMDNNIELPEEVDEILAGGFAETVLNRATTAMFEDDSDLRDRINYAENMSPFSGVMFWEMLGYDKAAYEMFLGASGHMSKKIAQRMGEAGDIFFHSPQLESHEKAMKAGKQLAQILPAVSDTTKAYLALKYGQLYDNSGDPKLRATALEGLSILAGYRPVSLIELDVTNRLLSEQKEDLKKDAKAYADMILREIQAPDQAAPEALARIEAMAAVMSSLPEDRKDALRQFIQDEFEFRNFKRRGELPRMLDMRAGRLGNQELRDAINNLEDGRFKKELTQALDEIEEK